MRLKSLVLPANSHCINRAAWIQRAISCRALLLAYHTPEYPIDHKGQHSLPRVQLEVPANEHWVQTSLTARCPPSACLWLRSFMAWPACHGLSVLEPGDPEAKALSWGCAVSHSDTSFKLCTMSGPEFSAVREQCWGTTASTPPQFRDHTHTWGLQAIVFPKVTSIILLYKMLLMLSHSYFKTFFFHLFY